MTTLPALPTSIRFSFNANSFWVPQCGSREGCSGIEQFVYSSVSDTGTGGAGVLIEYVLRNYGTDTDCEDIGWQSDHQGGCFMATPVASAPTQPITNLGNLEFIGTAGSAGDPWSSDYAYLYVGGASPTYYAVVASASVFYLYDSWFGTEFNVLGDASGREAIFNSGAALDLALDLYGQPGYPPYLIVSCFRQNESGESNNLDISACISQNPQNGSPAWVKFGEFYGGPK